MAPKPRVTRDMIVDASLALIRENGAEALNARNVARRLNCSTQPVLYHFTSMEELRRAVYDRADRFHTEYLLRPGGERDPLLTIGVNYIRFAVEEPRLFRFLFQSGCARETTIAEMIDSPALSPVLSAMSQGMGTDMEKTQKAFLILALFAHGYASIIANNNLQYDEETVAADLERAFIGAVAAVGQEDNNEKTL